MKHIAMLYHLDNHAWHDIIRCHFEHRLMKIIIEFFALGGHGGNAVLLNDGLQLGPAELNTCHQ